MSVSVLGIPLGDGTSTLECSACGILEIVPGPEVQQVLLDHLCHEHSGVQT